MNIRAAGLNDITSIYTLVAEHADRGDVLPRTLASIRDSVGDWIVVDQGGQIVGCASLLAYTSELAEVRSLAVHDQCKGNGFGAAILQALIVEAQRRNIPTLFALTRAVPFFQRAGFVIGDKARFPEKIWRDCVLCPVREECDETAVVLELESVPHLVNTDPKEPVKAVSGNLPKYNED